MKQILRKKDKGNFLSRYIKSFSHAVEGFWYAALYEQNMIIIVTAVVVVTLGGFLLNISKFEWLFCITAFGMVAASEMINTSIEAVVDLITVEYNPLAKIAKDTASAATLILSVTACAGAILIFVPKIIELF